MPQKLERASLEERRKHLQLGKLDIINDNTVDINQTNFIHCSDSRTRGAQRLYQEQLWHPVVFCSFLPCSVSDWNYLPISFPSAPSLESFQVQLGYSLDSLQPVPAAPWTPHEANITIKLQTTAFFFLLNFYWSLIRGRWQHQMSDVTAGQIMLSELCPQLGRERERERSELFYILV